MNIYVKAVNRLGKSVRVLHGRIMGERFCRDLESHHPRWSDKTFCLNCDAIKQFKKKKIAVRIIRFRHRLASHMKIYEITLKDAIKYGEKINELGEPNFRIPIIDCKLIKIKYFEGIEPVRERLEELQIRKRKIYSNTDQLTLAF